jgi:hypothetical protein
MNSLEETIEHENPQYTQEYCRFDLIFFVVNEDLSSPSSSWLSLTAEMPDTSLGFFFFLLEEFVVSM